MVLEGAYCPLAYVASVAFCGGELEVYALVMHKIKQGLTCLIVEALELGPEAMGDKDGVGALIRNLDLVAGPCMNCCCFYTALACWSCPKWRHRGSGRFDVKILPVAEK